VFHRQNSPKQRRFVCPAQDVTGAIVSSSRKTPMQVRKRSFLFFTMFDPKNNPFTKTGSGQT
jgi:hypothetical protein